MNFTVKPLSKDTWEDFAKLVEIHNGVWGGCWCIWFHQSDTIKRTTPEGNKNLKKQLVETDRAHAALVYDGDNCIAWCQYGSPQELPAIYHKKQVETTEYIWPDYRITCLFVHKDYRKKGVAKIAVEGALTLMKNAGGGIVEAYPQDAGDQKGSSSFLYNGTRAMFESLGFEFIGPKGKNHGIMRKNLN